MALVLRMIKKQARWLDPWEGLDRDSVRDDDGPADPVADLDTKGNALSVFVIESNRDNLERVVAALAANRESLQAFSYALFDENLLSEINIKCRATRAETPDDEVNGWHRDLIALTGLRLVALARAILDHASLDQRLPREVAALIRDAISAHHLDKSRCRLKADEWRRIGNA